MEYIYDNEELPRGTVIEVGFRDKIRYAIVLKGGKYVATGVRFHIVLMGLSKVEVFRDNTTGFRIGFWRSREGSGVYA